MAEPLVLRVSLDEETRARLRRFAGSNPASVGWVLGRVVEAGLAERKRLLAAIGRRLEQAFVVEQPLRERAGIVPVPAAAKTHVALASLAGALEHTPAGAATLVAAIVLADQEWALAVITAAMNDRARPR